PKPIQEGPGQGTFTGPIEATSRLGTSSPKGARAAEVGPAPASFSPGGDPLASQKCSRKYITRHKQSAQLWRRAARLTPGGVESNIRYFRPHPFLADYGDGGYIYDVDGNKILDFMMAFAAVLLGHNNRDIALEVIKQLESGSMLGVTSE